VAIRLKKEPRLDPRYEAFAYQAEAVRAIRDKEYAAIFHEQGLGKSKIAIDLALYWLDTKVVDTVILVAKNSLVTNWWKEIANHTHLKPRLISQNRKSNFYTFNSPARLMLMHYEVFISEKERLLLFLKTRNVGMILDESAKIKNPDSGVAKALFEIAPFIKKRIIMTGTPVANRPYDVWAQIYFLDHGLSLGSDFKKFKKDLDLNNDLGHDENSQRHFEFELTNIYNKIQNFSVRETKKSGIISLPEKIITLIPVAWESRQKELYDQIRKELKTIVVKDGIPIEEDADSILKRMLRLVQIASNPHLIDESYNGNPGKLEILTDLVQSIIDNNEKCIIWTSFTDNVDWLAKRLIGFGCVKIHGKLTMLERNNSVTRFMTDPECRVLLATPGAAKEGLTLTVANHVIFYDRSFSLDDYLQAQDRIHRISQTKTCYVHNLIMEDSIDEWVDILLTSKELAAQLAQGDISLESYRSQMSYEFGDILREILGLQITQRSVEDE